MRTRISVGVVLGALVLAACGDDDSPPIPSDASPGFDDGGGLRDAGAGRDSGRGLDAGETPGRDAGPVGSDGGGADTGVCFLGPPCTPPDACAVARIDCTGTCRTVGVQPMGAPCPGGYCDGTTEACVMEKPMGDPCSTGHTCEEGRVAFPGGMPTCVAVGLRPAGTACRGVFTDCDIVETCDGASIDCPDDTYAAAGTPCAGGTCDGAGACR